MLLLKIVEVAKINAPAKTVDSPMILNTGGLKGEAIRIEGTKRGEEKGNDSNLMVFHRPSPEKSLFRVSRRLMSPLTRGWNDRIMRYV